MYMRLPLIVLRRNPGLLREYLNNYFNSSSASDLGKEVNNSITETDITTDEKVEDTEYADRQSLNSDFKNYLSSDQIALLGLLLFYTTKV